MCQRVKENEARRHGLQAPLHPYQILVWTTILLSIIQFVTIVVPYHPGDLHLWIPSAIYGGLWIVGCSNFLWVSLTDPRTKRTKRATTEMQSVEGQHSIPMHDPQENQPEMTECTKCGAMKLPDTKHCNLCHKCIDDFDHHCVYLNTCVGGINYWNFFTLITCLTLFFIDQLYCCAHWAVQYYFDNQDYVDAVNKSYLGGQGHILLGIITGVIPFAGLLLISSLEGFHILIIILRTTTYKWIIERRRAKAEAQYKAEQTKAEKLKLAAAKAAGKNKGVELTSTATTTSSEESDAAYREWQAKQAKDKEERLKKEARFEKEREAKRKLLDQKSSVPESILPTVESQEHSFHEKPTSASAQTHSTQPSQSISRLTHNQGDVSLQEDSTDFEGEALMDGARRSASGIRISPAGSQRPSSVIVKPSKKQSSEMLLRGDDDEVDRRLSLLGVASMGEALGDKGKSSEKDGSGEKERRQWKEDLPGGNQSDDETTPERSISLPDRTNSQSLHAIQTTSSDSPQKDV